MELDETVCNRAVCQHPQCWVTLRRIEQGNPRYRLPSSISRHPSQDEGGLPVLSVTTLHGGRTMHNGGDSHHCKTEELTSGASSTALYKICNSTATCSMEKVFFPGVNSYSKIVAPSQKSGSCFSRKSQKVEILHPSFQDTKSGEMTMVWVPNAQHKPPRTEEREKPLKVWIKDFSFTELQGGTRVGKKSPTHETINKKQKKPPTGGCPINLTLVGCSTLPHTKNCMVTRGIIVENRRVVLHDTREKCLDMPHTGPVYRLDEQYSSLRNNTEIDLDSIRNQSYLWKKYMHFTRPSHSTRTSDHRTSSLGTSHKSAALDKLGQIGLYPYDPDSALSYYKSQASETPTGSAMTTRSRDSDSRISPSLAEFSQRSLPDEDPSAAARDPPQPAEMEAKKRAQQEAQPVKPTEAVDITPQLPALEQNDVFKAEEATGPNTSPDPPESGVQSTVVPQNPEQRTSSPQPSPPPPSPML